MGPFDQAPIGSLLTWPVAWRPHGDRVDRSTRRHYAGNAMGQTRLHEACIYHRSNAIGGSNCLGCQALINTPRSLVLEAFHFSLFLTMLLRIRSNFRIHAVRATFFGLPRAQSRR